MKLLSSSYSTKSISSFTTIQMVLHEEHPCPITLRIMKNNKVIAKVPYEYIFDMVMGVAKEIPLNSINNLGLKRRLMTMLAGESHLNEPLNIIKKGFDDEDTPNR